MRKVLALCFAILLLQSKLSAKIITVSNNINSPGQYNDLQTAIDAASRNDTLLVSGSPTTYGSNGVININKKLVLFGQGYDPRKDVGLPSTITTVNFNAGSDSSVMSGFYINSSINAAAPVGNLIIKRNKIGSLTISGNNIVISENIFTGTLYGNGAISGVLISNNIFSASSYSVISFNSSSTINILIKNNCFAYVYPNSPGFTGVCIVAYNAIISNNIFYQKSTAASENAIISSASVNCVVNNNLTFNFTNANPFNIGVNNITGSGNQINVNPLYVAYDLSTRLINRNDNFQLQAGSPAKNAGTDGKDIGAYGGSNPIQFPLSGEPAIPQIKSMNIDNTVVPSSGTLKVRVKANSNN